jgi:hypothetical protein
MSIQSTLQSVASADGGKTRPVNPALQSFISVALPIMVTLVATIWIASWSQNKRFDDLRSDMNRRFDDTNRRIDEVAAGLRRVEQKLDNHEQWIVRVEERTSPLR